MNLDFLAAYHTIFGMFSPESSLINRIQIDELVKEGFAHHPFDALWDEFLLDLYTYAPPKIRSTLRNAICTEAYLWVKRKKKGEPFPLLLNGILPELEADD